MARLKIPQINLSKDWKSKMVEKTHFSISNVLRVSIVAASIRFIIESQYFLAFTSIIILLLTFLPAILQRNYRLTIPIEFEFFIVFFIYASLFLGEIRAYYVYYPWWDLFLHTLSGVLLGAIGFTLVYVLNTNPRVQLKMQPGFIAFFALCFAITTGVVWEIFEFAMDSIFGFNMQKSGLVDTMWDLIVDSLGALVAAILGYLSLKYGKAFFMDRAIYKFVHNNPQIFKWVDARDKGRIKKHFRKIKGKLKGKKQ